MDLRAEERANRGNKRVLSEIDVSEWEITCTETCPREGKRKCNTSKATQLPASATRSRAARLKRKKEKGKEEAPPYQESPATDLQARRSPTPFVLQLYTTRALCKGVLEPQIAEPPATQAEPRIRYRQPWQQAKPSSGARPTEILR
jgi:hypothetical protein